jgi:hypothetical protein
MKLSEHEAREVRRWQQQEQWWRRMRWVLLIASALFALSFGVVTCWIISTSYEAGPDPLMQLVVAWGSPLCWLCLFVSVHRFWWTLANWPGDLKTHLLLKLLSDHESTD